MTDAKNLLDQLDAAPDEDREPIWAASSVALTPDDIRDAALADRSCLGWLVLRYDVGPPGRPLPDAAEAQATLLRGDGSAPDAYAAIFAGPDVEAADEILHLLHNAAVAAFSGGAEWLGAWLASRAALACLALGQPKRAWEWLEALTRGDERHPEMEKVAAFLPVRGHSDLEASPWVRVAVCFLWPRLQVRAIPVLPLPRAVDQPLAEALARLDQVGATKVRSLVETFLRSVESQEARQRADEPLVRELERRALAGEGAPHVDVLPDWFEDWARQMGRQQRHRIGYLAGHILHAQGTEDATLTAMLVLPLAKAADLPILRAGFKDERMAADLLELEQVAVSVPSRVADALVALALPRHEHGTEAIGVLIPEREVLAALRPRAGGLLEHVLTMIHEIRTSREQDHAESTPRLAALHAAVRSAVDRLGDPRQLAASDVERAAAGIASPEITLGLLELTQESELPALDRLIQAVVLLRAVGGTPHEALWAPGLRRDASQAIWRLGVVRLFDLRIRLLDELIREPGPIASMAELHFQRANSRRALQSSDEESARQVVADLVAAVEHARRNGELEFLADAVAMLARIAAEDDEFNEDIARNLDEVLGLPVAPERRGMLLQAKAHLVRGAEPGEAAALLGQAIEHLPADDPHRWEVGAERVLALTGAAKLTDAIAEGRALVRAVTERASDTVIAMVHHALGYALEAAGDLVGARAEYGRALDRTRGVDGRNEAANRVRIARLSLLADDQALWTQQFRVFRERWEALPAVIRRDIAGLVGEAGRRGWIDRTIASDMVSSVGADQPPRQAAVASLQRARIALDAGEHVDLDRVLRDALPHAEIEEVRQLVLELACNHSEGLGTDVLDLVLEGARRWRRPVAQARLLVRLGRSDEARALLEDALTSELEPSERLGCVHMLITLLGEGREDDRLALCQKLEDLLARDSDHHTIRADLAQCFRLLADGDRALLERAWTHGVQALGGLRTARDVAHGHRVVALVVNDLVRAQLAEPRQDIVERAQWLLQDHPIAPDELTRIRHAVAHNLLVPGPLCRPDALDVADRLLNLVCASGHAPDGVAGLQDRVRWLRDLTVETSTGSAKPDGVDGPADALPTWLVRLVAGHEVRPTGAEIERDLDAVALVLHVRPDAADRVLARLVRLVGTLSPPTIAALFQVIHQEVSGAKLGAGAWQELERALASMKARNRPRIATDIEAAIQGARDGVPRVPNRTVMGPVGSRERAEEAFGLAVELMRVVNAEPMAAESKSRIREARKLLQEAVDIARRKKLPHLSDFLISLGNAWKMPPDQDVERALGIYEKVARRELHPQQEAKLWKVHADALRQRGAPEDLRRAFQMLLKSAKARSGAERAASLFSAAEVAWIHPDYAEDERAARAVELGMDATRAHAASMEDTLGVLLVRLGEWKARSPDDERPESFRHDLRSRYPHRVGEIDRPARLPPKEFGEHLLATLAHPASMAYMRVASRLMRPEQLARDPFGMKARLGRAAAEAIEKQQAEDSILGDPDRLAAELASLGADPDPEAAPGVALARVRLLAELCRCGRASLKAVRQASAEARAAHAAVGDSRVRSFLIREHARIWNALDHADDRVRDFALAVDLAREALAVEGGEERASTDTMELVARSLRYSPHGDLSANLEEACRVYGVLVKRARAEGDAELIANALHCLAEAKSHSARGDRLSRLRAGEADIEEAVRTAASPFKRAEFTSSLAWQRTQIALRLQGPARVEALRSALATFDAVETRYLETAHEQRNHRLNRAVCLGSLERETRGRQAEVEVWRAELAVAEPAGHAHHTATLRHNLANALLIGDDVTASEIAGGLDLCERALRSRTLEANPRHHWETTLLAGGVLANLLEARTRGVDVDLPWSDDSAWERARSWLRKAIAASRILGPGEELANAAGALASLARTARSTRDAIDVAEEAWSAMRDAMPFLLLHQESAAREAMRALDLAMFVAWRLSQEGVQAAARDLLFVMEGERAKMVLRWLLRAYAPLRRPVHARLRRPDGVGLDTWSGWQDALAARDPVAIASALRHVRAEAPGFLGEEPDLGTTWRWLRTRPGAVAITVVVAETACLVVVLSMATDGRERVQVLAVPVTDPPVDGNEFWHAMTEATNARSNAAALHDAMASWARRQIVEPVVRYLRAAPTAVLWCPGQVLRLVAPRALWGQTPVALSLAPALPDLLSAPPRARSSLLVLADPASGALDLRGMGLPAVERLAVAAAARGQVRTLVSVGAAHGPDVAGERALSRPASAASVLEVARDHDVLVLVAHGEAPSPEHAAIVLLDEGGAVERLDVARMAANPGAFTGATVVLLSCETGKVGAAFHDAGGVAGALIAAGAKAVVAPLWPVRLDVAEAVAQAVLQGLASGRDPFEVLADLHVRDAEGGVLLGPPPPMAAQNRLTDLQRWAFVSWIG